jgi:hypothetical protein
LGFTYKPPDPTRPYGEGGISVPVRFMSRALRLRGFKGIGKFINIR